VTGQATRVDPDRWLSDRRYLNQHRDELTRTAQELYPRDLRVDGTPLLAPPAWLPDRPVPLDQVELIAAEHTPARIQDTGPESYAAAIARLARPKLFENRACYRLLDASARQLTFGAGRYFDLINTCEAVAHEYAAATRGQAGRPPDPSQLPLRAAIGDPTDLTRRPVMAAISALVLRRSPDPGGDARMILHWRDPAKVATGGGLYTVAPVGMFQPSHDAPWNHAGDFSLWRSLVRELAEELLGHPEDYGSEREPIDYDGWPLYQRLTDAQRGRTFWLGLGVDPLSLVVDMLIVAVFDAPLYDSLFRWVDRDNDEGRLLTRPFTEAAVHSGGLEASSAALLRRAWRSRKALLRP
jgi:hypothetical protein